MLVKPLLLKLAGLVGLALILALGVQSARLSSARATIAEKDREIGGLNMTISLQNAAVQRLEAEGRAAQARADAAVSEALRVNDRQQPVIVRLGQSAARQRGAGERCEISPELRGAEGL